MSDETKEKERQRLIEQLKEMGALHPKVLRDALANELVRRYRATREAEQ
jgi:hypothetical protein